MALPPDFARVKAINCKLNASSNKPQNFLGLSVPLKGCSFFFIHSLYALITSFPSITYEEEATTVSSTNIATGSPTPKYNSFAFFIDSEIVNVELFAISLLKPSNHQFRIPSSSFDSFLGRSLSCSDSVNVLSKGNMSNLRSNP